MKKLLLFCVSLLLTGTTLLGQTTLLTEGWESATNNSNVPPTGWGIDLLGYTNITYYMSSGTYPTVAPFEGSRLVDFESYSYGTNTTNRLKRTTAISTVGYSNITVDFEWYTDPGYAGTTTEGVIVQWSTDGSTWTSAGTTFMRYAATAQWVLETQALPAGAAGQATLYVAFLFNSNFGNDCHMDIMHVKGTAAPVVLLGEGWELATNNSNVPPPGWGIDLLGYTNITYYFSSGTYPTVTPYEGSRLVDFESYSYGTNTTNRLKRTTPISTVGYTAINVDFAWYTDPGYAGTTTEGVIIQWSTDGATWTSAGTTWMRYSTTAQWVINTQNLPMGAENQPTLYIAFLFNSNFGNDCHMDIIHVKGTGAALPPTVTTTAATNILASTATLNGTVNANGTSTAVSFQYGLTVAYGSTVAGVPTPVTGNSATAVLANISGLSPNTLYHYRCVGGATNGNDMTFTTANAPPTVVTTAATNILTNTATLNGTVNPNGVSSTVSFDYGLTIAYGTNIAGVPSPVTGSSPVAVAVNIAGLTPGTLYHFRVNGTNVGGTTNGNDMTFTTSAVPPTVVTTAATGVGGTSATLNGTINPNSAPTTSGFDYGLSIGYGSSVAGVPLNLSGNTVQAVNAAITGLTNNSVYHFRAKGTNAGGTTYGNDQTFVIGCPTAGPAGPLSGPTQVCQGQCGYVYSVTIPNATGYIWTVPVGGSITSGANTNTITVCYAANAVSGYMFVYGTAPCGNGAPSQLAVAVNPPASPTIAGPSSVCLNSTGNVYSTQAGFSNYIWTVSAGGTVTAGGGINNNTITITWGTVGAKTVSVNYNTAAGCPALAPTVYNVTVNALPVPTISGPSPACSNVPAVYNTQAGMGAYTWTVSAGGSITSGAGTNAITVNWTATGAQTVSVNYTNTNGCTAAAPVVYPVTVNQTNVPTITGSDNLCVNSGYYTYTTETGMTAYNWTISPGGVINFGSGTNVITVSWVASGAQWVKVNYMNPSGCSPVNPTQLNITVNALPGSAGTITGTATVCGGANGVAYSVAAVTGAASYVWTLPAGATIATGASTNAITVNFAGNASSGNITVYANNVCGNGSSSPAFGVSVTPLPGTAGTITGTASVCVGATGVAYSIPAVTGASSYIWTVPLGAAISGGLNTNNITVDFPTGAVSGNITVYATNSCGNGTVSPNFAVTVNAIPATPVVTNTGDTLHSSAPTGNQWYFEGTLIVGATAQKYVATQDGLYWTIVTVNGCSSAESNHKQIITTGIDTHSSSSINVYPVPNDGRFNVTITNASAEIYTIHVYNGLGIAIYEEAKVEVNGTLQKVIDLRPVANGVYTVIFENGQSQVVKKVVVNK